MDVRQVVPQNRAAGAVLPGPVPAVAGHRTAAREFEALVAGQLVNIMLDAANSGSLMGEDGPGQIWQGVLADAIGRDMASAGALGIAPAIEIELRRADGGRP